MEKRIPIEPQKATYDLDKEAAAMASLYGVIGEAKKIVPEVKQKASNKTVNNRPSKEELEGLYLKQELSMAKIGEIYRVTPNAVHLWLKKYGIQTRKWHGGKNEKKKYEVGTSMSSPKEEVPGIYVGDKEETIDMPMEVEEVNTEVVEEVVAANEQEEADVELLEVKLKAGVAEIVVRNNIISISNRGETNTLYLTKKEVSKLVPGLIKASLIDFDKLI